MTGFVSTLMSQPATETFQKEKTKTKLEPSLRSLNVKPQSGIEKSIIVLVFRTT